MPECDVPRHLAMCLRCFTMKNKRLGHPWCDRCMDEYEPPEPVLLPVGYEPRLNTGSEAEAAGASSATTEREADSDSGFGWRDP